MFYNIKEKIAKQLFFICALMTVTSFVLITCFIFAKGLPGIINIGVKDFIFGTRWAPRERVFGIFPMLINSLIVTFSSFFISAYIGKWTAIYLAFFCKGRIYEVLKYFVELMAGIPSIVFGFFGAVVIVPLVRDFVGGSGKSLLSAIIVLFIMILPTIINLAENSLRLAPKQYYEGALALGSSHHEAIFKVVAPACSSGIKAAYILGIGRALGETTAILLVIGNTPALRTNLLKSASTLTTSISMEMGYATGPHQQALFGIGVVLFILILILNIFLSKVTKD